MTKSETLNQMDELFSKALNGFMLVLSSDGNMIYLSENVSDYLGISQVRFPVKTKKYFIPMMESRGMENGEEGQNTIPLFDHSALILVPDGYDGSKRVRIQPSVRPRGIAGMPVLETAREHRETCLQFFLTTQVYIDQQRKEGQSKKRLLQGRKHFQRGSFVEPHVVNK